jgi:malonate-semialdehyde dehydrogenase (acetylating) / methylmalonate-semialdehyde dehydrogenase
MAVHFTSSGGAAREFRERVQAPQMVRVNPLAGGPALRLLPVLWPERVSFYGDLHVHGLDGVDFYTRTKVVVSRWDRLVAGRSNSVLGQATSQ